MELKFALLFGVVGSLAILASSVRADDASMTLDLNYSSGAGSAGSWRLLGRIDDTGSGANGDFGLSSVRALIDGIDFGTDGDAIFLAAGVGAINPIAENTPFERPAAIELAGGTIDLVYGQDLSESETFPGSGVFRSVVTLVGNGGDVLLASGTFSAGSDPIFGQDGASLSTQALFLTSSTSPFVGSIDADNTNTLITLAADYNADGVVDAADYTQWRDTEGSTVDLAADGDNSGTVDAGDYVVWANNFGVSLAATSVAVPEPSSLTVAFALASLLSLARKQPTNRFTEPKQRKPVGVEA